MLSMEQAVAAHRADSRQSSGSQSLGNLNLFRWADGKPVQTLTQIETLSSLAWSGNKYAPFPEGSHYPHVLRLQYKCPEKLLRNKSLHGRAETP